MTQLIAFKRILFPTDFSAASADAHAYVIGLAKQLDATVHLFHAIEPIEMDLGERDPEVDDFYKKLETRANVLMKQVVAEFDEAGVELTYEVKVGRRWKEIVQRAEDLKIDLIVMGTHGLRVDDDQVVLGSTSHRVPYIAPCPVMLVRSDADQTLNEA